MITVLSRKPDDLASPDVSKVNKEIIEYCGLSTDEKPNGLIVTGSTFLEIDTGDLYIYNEEAAEWVQFINIKDAAGGGGGGGSSDFTTCTMTVIGDNPVSLILPFIDEGDYAGVPAIIADGESFAVGEYTIPLYKGTATGEVTEISELVVTGNAEIDDEGYITVTGDFTIGVSSSDT